MAAVLVHTYSRAEPVVIPIGRMRIMAAVLVHTCTLAVSAVPVAADHMCTLVVPLDHMCIPVPFAVLVVHKNSVRRYRMHPTLVFLEMQEPNRAGRLMA
ncbi:hypothetical protein TcG_06464, partial [Trypanosoma cruzi]